MCIFGRRCVYMWAYVCMCVEVRGQLKYPWLLFILCFKTGSHTKPEAHWFSKTGMANGIWRSAHLSHSQDQPDISLLPLHGLLFGCWTMDSGSYGYWANTLSKVPYCQAAHFQIFNKDVIILITELHHLNLWDYFYNYSLQYRSKM